MAVQGNLKDISLTSLISINCNEMNRACLSLLKSGQKALIYFDEGNIVHAELDAQEGEEVLYEVLGWSDGDFNLEQGVEPPKQSVHTPWSGLLLEGMHRLDEFQGHIEPEDDAGLDFLQTEQAGRILAAAKRIQGVRAALLCSNRGEWIRSQDADVLAAWPELASVLLRFINGLGKDMRWGALNCLLISEANDRWLVLPYGPGILVLSCSQRTSTADLIQAVGQIQQRYPLEGDA